MTKRSRKPLQMTRQYVAYGMQLVIVRANCGFPWLYWSGFALADMHELIRTDKTCYSASCQLWVNTTQMAGVTQPVWMVHAGHLYLCFQLHDKPVSLRAQCVT